MSRAAWICCLILAPAIPPASAEDNPTPDLSRRIDQAVSAACTTEGIVPTPVCDDATFLRRAWLDLAGRVPPLAEAQALTAETGSTPRVLDRAQAVDRLLKSPEFATNWGLVWTEYLTDHRPFDTPEYDGRLLFRYLRDSFAKNVPHDQLAAALIQGEGASDVSGAANFLLRYMAEPAPLAGAVGQKFLGLTLQCAECHNHPHASWTRQDFWGLAAYFGRLRRMNPANPADGENFVIVLERPRGELLLVDKQAKPNEDGSFPMRTVFPKLPGATRTDTSRERRAALIRWVTSPDNPYFARHGANEIWFRLIGTRLVDTLDKPAPDDSSLANTLLEQLRDSFVTSGFDRNALIRGIVLSDTWQRSAAGPSPSAEPTETKPSTPSKSAPPVDTAKADVARPSKSATAESTAPRDSARSSAEKQPAAASLASRLAVASVRPLSADQVHFSIVSATGYVYDDGDHRLADATGEPFTYDLPINSFGDTPASLRRSLALFNSEHIRGTADAASESALRVHGPSAGSDHIRRLFLSLLTREPEPEELEAFLNLAGGDSPKAGLEDAAWVLLNSAEFNTNH